MRLPRPHRNLLNATIAWFADGRDIAVIPADDAPPAGGSSHTKASPRSSACPLDQPTTCLIIVRQGSPRGILTARALVMNAPDNMFNAPDALSPDTAAPRSLLLGNAGWHDQQNLGPLSIDQITPHKTQVTVRQVLTITSAAAMAFSPTGARLLYAHGPNPRKLWLWETTITTGRPDHPQVLIRQSQVGSSAAW